jgi:hypothetical protein
VQIDRRSNCYLYKHRSLWLHLSPQPPLPRPTHSLQCRHPLRTSTAGLPPASSHLGVTVQASVGSSHSAPMAANCIGRRPTQERRRTTSQRILGRLLRPRETWKRVVEGKGLGSIWDFFDRSRRTYMIGSDRIGDRGRGRGRASGFFRIFFSQGGSRIEGERFREQVFLTYERTF